MFATHRFVRCGMDEHDMSITVTAMDGLLVDWPVGSKITGICHDTGLPFHRELLSLASGDQVPGSNSKEFHLETAELHFSALFEDLEFKLTYEVPGHEDLLTNDADNDIRRNLRTTTTSNADDEDDSVDEELFSPILKPLDGNVPMVATSVSRAHRARRRLGLWDKIKDGAGDAVDTIGDTAGDVVDGTGDVIDTVGDGTFTRTC